MDIDPYLPPAQDPSPEGTLVEHGRLWRVEDGKVLVQDGAILPDVCILGGSAGVPGNRIMKELNPLRSWRLPERKIQISVFQSAARISGWRIFLWASVAALLALTRCSVHSRVDRPWEVMVVLLAVAVVLLVATKELKLSPSRDGWYELKNLSPRALDELIRVFRTKGMTLSQQQRGAETDKATVEEIQGRVKPSHPPA